MNPQHDRVMSLLETPFSRRNEVEQPQILEQRPTPKIDIVSADKLQNRTYSRTFQNSWYEMHKWLCGSSYTSRLYCWPCLLLGTAKNLWNTTGYNDLKNFARSAKKHNDSKEHIKNFLGLKRIERNASTTTDALQEHTYLNKILYNENVKKNRQLMCYLIDVTILLGSQELSIRGLDESTASDNCGNFKEIFECLIKRNVEISEHTEKVKNIFTGQYKTVQNQLISCCENYLREFIDGEINNANYFAIITDDITNISEKSQCSITVRFVDNGNLKERFLGSFDISADRTANALFDLITNVLEPFNFKQKLVAQCYDGASVMAGELNGIQSKIKSVAPLALFTQCAAHRLNLVLRQSSSSNLKVRVFFATIMSIPVFLNHSPKRTFVLNQIMQRSVANTNETQIVNLVHDEWDNFVNVFERIVNDRNSGLESITKAYGFCKTFNDFDFTILTIIYKKIFLVTDLLYKILQTKYLSIKYCFSQIASAVSGIRTLRNKLIFDEIFEAAQGRTALPNKCGQDEDEIKTSYKILFYEILDCVIIQLDTRFADLSRLEFLALVDSSRYNEYCKEFPQQALNTLLELYPNIFQKDRLVNELSNVYLDHQFHNIDLQSSLNMIHTEFLEVFPETYKLLSLILTIPAKSVPVEQHFSCLSRIKTASRNSMSQDSLCGLSLMSMEKSLLKELSSKPEFYDIILNKYANMKDRWLDLIFKT